MQLHHKHTILSAIMSVFLTGTLVLTAAIISNPNISFDVRKFASGDDWMNEPTLTVNSVKTTVNPANGTAYTTVSYTQGGVTNTINTNATVNSNTGNRQTNTTVTNAKGNVIVNRSSTDTMNRNGQLTTTHAVDTRTNADGTTNTFDTSVNTNPTSGQRAETTTQNGVTITQNGQYVSGYNPNDPNTQPASNPSCGTGYKLNTSTHQCDQNMNPDQIDALTANCNAQSGKHYDQETGQCLSVTTPTTAPRTICGTGYTYNSSTNKCDTSIAPDHIDALATSCNANAYTHYDSATGHCVSLSTPLTFTPIPSSTPNSINPNVTYKIQCQPGFASSDNLHCLPVPASTTPSNAPGCNLKCGTGQYCKASGAGRTGGSYQCVAAPTAPSGNIFSDPTVQKILLAIPGFSNYVSTQQQLNAQYGTSGANRIWNGQSFISAAPIGLEAGTAAVAAAVGATELAGAATSIYGLAGGSIAALPTATAAYGSAALTTTIAGLSPLAQIGIGTGITALTVGGTVSMASHCAQTYGLDPNCAFLAAPMVNDIVGTGQALAAGPQMISSGANTLINNAMSGLTGAEVPGYSGLGTYGGQTIISRSNMPTNLSPQEQALWIARHDLAENATYWADRSAKNWTNISYQPNSANSVYQTNGMNLDQRLANIPNPGNNTLLEDLKRLANTGTTTDELFASAKNAVSNNGVIILDTPPPADAYGQIVMPDGTITYFPTSPKIYGQYSGPFTGKAMSDQGALFAFPTDPNSMPGITFNQDSKIFLTPAIPDSTKGISTLMHEYGHLVETELMPTMPATFHGVTELAHPSTEYVSSLYGIAAGQLIAPTSINNAVDVMIPNILLNELITSGQISNLGY
jgi:hypothetical protein